MVSKFSSRCDESKSNIFLFALKFWGENGVTGVLSFLLSLEIGDFERERRREVYRGNIWCQSGELCLLDHSPDLSQQWGPGRKGMY